MFLHLSVILLTGGCLVLGRGVWDAPRDQVPWTRPPQDQTPCDQNPPDRTPPGTRHPPQIRPLGIRTPPPRPGPPRPDTPLHLKFFLGGAYGQRAGGTHPTGMHSCCKKFWKKRKCLKRKKFVLMFWLEADFLIYDSNTIKFKNKLFTGYKILTGFTRSMAWKNPEKEGK